MERKSQKLRRNEGFTLIEITIAVVILAMGLSIILGLQSSAVTQSLRDRNKEIALLAGRRILAHLEVDEGDLNTEDNSGPLPKLLERFGATEKDGDGKEDAKLSDYTARLQIEPWGIPDADPEAMKRVVLTISWSDSPSDSVELAYFVPSNKPSASPTPS